MHRQQVDPLVMTTRGCGNVRCGPLEGRGARFPCPARRCVWFVVCILTLAAGVHAQDLRWAPSYKIKPHETDRLTPADVVGPDGLVYPDWRYAGVRGGIPDVPVVARIEEFGGQANDGQDDSSALLAAGRHVARQGGGAILLGAGTYHLDRPVIFSGDAVVVRGQGADKTELLFRYAPSPGQIVFFGVEAGDVVGPQSTLDIHAHPDGLKRIALEVDGNVVAERTRAAHWGGTFMRRVSGRSLGSRAGKRQLTAIAEWDDGQVARKSITVQVDPRHELPAGQRSVGGYGLGAIMFSGARPDRTKYLLARDGKRGDMEITLKSVDGLVAGDAIALEAPATPRWNKLVQNACKWGSYRVGQFEVTAVDGNRIRLNQPLRIEFPIVDGSYVTRLNPIRRCGVEDLTLRQTKKLWTSGILFESARDCWVRRVRVVKAGRHPVYTRSSKWCEVRDCELEDAWYQGGGGTAYVGWERSYDCLMENVTTWRMRHAPCVQWSSSGNVIRNSTFHGSDAQWHAGWTNENLFELCTVNAEGSWGTYGHGGWASPPHDTAHGPEGPRNVIYNCDFRAPKTGLWMGGMNENWLILHNRFIVQQGPGILARLHSFDHVIRGNVIAVKNERRPAIELADANCVGVELEHNRVYVDSGKLVAGPAQPASERGNRVMPHRADPPRPAPEVPSIFQWQRQHAGSHP